MAQWRSVTFGGPGGNGVSLIWGPSTTERKQFIDYSTTVDYVTLFTVCFFVINK